VHDDYDLGGQIFGHVQVSGVDRHRGRQAGPSCATLSGKLPLQARLGAERDGKEPTGVCASEIRKHIGDYLIGAAFVLMLVQLYRSMHGKGSSGQGGSSGGKGPGGGRGGMNDMFNMGKSNVQVFGVDKKIKTRFKHVAGME
jgi:hypothetical protein